MKKLILLTLTGLFVLGISSCDGKKKNNNGMGKRYIHKKDTSRYFRFNQSKHERRW